MLKLLKTHLKGTASVVRYRTCQQVIAGIFMAIEVWVFDPGDMSGQV